MIVFAIVCLGAGLWYWQKRSKVDDLGVVPGWTDLRRREAEAVTERLLLGAVGRKWKTGDRVVEDRDRRAAAMTARGRSALRLVSGGGRFQ